MQSRVTDALSALLLSVMLIVAGIGTASAESPYMVVLGIAQDGGVPQLGNEDHPAWSDPSLRQTATSLALVAPRLGHRWLFEATPDLREQLHLLHQIAPLDRRPGLEGIFLTHAHIGHYTGLMLLGHESLGAHQVPVYAMPRMRTFLETNGPWDQLTRYQNIQLRDLAAGHAVPIAADIAVTPIPVPHRQEYSEVVGFRIQGPNRSVLFIPDIDSWTDWEHQGVRLEDQLQTVDRAWLDGTFFANGEIPGRDMTGFPHPRISETMARLSALPAELRARLHFIHLNHSNPALQLDSEQARKVIDAGFGLARPGDRFEL